MKLGDVLENLEYFKNDKIRGKRFIHNAINRGYIDPVKIPKENINRYDFSERDAEKIELLAKLKEEGNKWNVANAHAESILSKKYSDAKDVIIEFKHNDGYIKNSIIHIRGTEIYFLTGENGRAISIEYPIGSLFDPAFDVINIDDYERRRRKGDFQKILKQLGLRSEEIIKHPEKLDELKKLLE